MRESRDAQLPVSQPRRFTSTPGKRFWIILGFSVLARIAALAAVGPVVEMDSFGYDNLAQNIVNGNGYRDTRPFSITDASLMRTPLYPLFLAAIYAVFGRELAVVALMQQLVSLALVVVIFRLATAIFDQQTGFYTALVLAVHPWLTLYGNAVMTETVFGALVGGAVATLVVAIERESPRMFAVTGLLLGLSVLCRPTMMAFVLLVPVLLLPRWDLWVALRRALACGLPCALVVVPWVARNYFRHGYFGLAPIVGTVLLMRVDPPAGHLLGDDPMERALREACGSPTEPVLPLLPESEEYRAHLRSTSASVPCVYRAARILVDQGYSLPTIDRGFLGIAKRAIVEKPIRYLVGAAFEAGFLWSGYPSEWLGGKFDKRLQDNRSAGEHAVVAVKLFLRVGLGFLLVAVMAVGVYFVIREHHRLGLLPVVLVAYITILTAMLNVAELRFRFPFEPYAIMLGVWGVRRLARVPADRTPEWRTSLSE